MAFHGSKNFKIGTLADQIEVYANSQTQASQWHRGNITGTQKKWAGELSTREVQARFQSGDMECAAMSDKMLSDIEKKIQFPSTRNVIVDDVVGAFPNVPAYLAGTPLTMRRRVRQETEATPIAVFVNLMASAYVSSNALMTRGAAALAFVRAIAGVRPVELFVGAIQGFADAYSEDDARAVFYRIDTAPLDLARAAFCVGHTSSYRHGAMIALFDQFPMINRGLPLVADIHAEAIVRKNMPHFSDVLMLHGLRSENEVTRNPVQWVIDNLKKYGADTAE